MPSSRLDRRDFCFFAGSCSLAAIERSAAQVTARADGPHTRRAIPDDGWHLWVDEAAHWQDDQIFLPDDVDLRQLPVNQPTGGWDALDTDVVVSLPSTVEQHYWGRYGLRPYTPEEYSYASRDSAPQNGAYCGVSWWWRDIEIPACYKGRRILLHIRGARMRAEVYLNCKLVGYSIMEELPFVCDLSAAAEPNGKNRLAIRITNPGGRYDWVDGEVIRWGKVELYRSHGFGGLDRGLTLSAHPLDGHIEDVWVLNRPDPRSVNVFIKISNGSGDVPPKLDILGHHFGRRLPAEIRFVGRNADNIYEFSITAKTAKLWRLNAPYLYRLRVRWVSPRGGESIASVVFGFRWFSPDGIGKNAVLRLNGKRIKIYSAISWGYWGMNGLWPTLDLAEKEVLQAKTLGLNCLNFHRNVGKEDVFSAHDRHGLLRVMEPGGGKFAIGKWPDGLRTDANSVVMQTPKTDAERFSAAFMTAKCVAMVKAFRSHPSLIQYTLQNEAGADLSDQASFAALNAMRAEDPSRCIVLNDGMTAPPTSAAQIWYAPYDQNPHRSDREPFGGWWNGHQGAGEQWYDEFYGGPKHFNYRQDERAALVQFGEMEGCAIPDDHEKMIAEILHRGGSSYDLSDHRRILAAYDAFLDRWGFRKAFPSASDLFTALGRRSYLSWQQYLENARICDAADIAVISGWESTAIDNHSGIVDNLRNCKSDPAIIRDSLAPVRPLTKQHSLIVACGNTATFDIYILNDTGVRQGGNLIFSMIGPDGAKQRLGIFPLPTLPDEQFSGLIKAGFITPPLPQEGRYRFECALSDAQRQPHLRDIWAVDAAKSPVAGRVLRVAIGGLRNDTIAQLQAVPGIALTKNIASCDVIVAGGLTEQSSLAQRLGGDAGVQLQRQTNVPPIPGHLSAEAMSAVKTGTPLFVIAQEDALADGLASQLAEAGAFSYRGQVGGFRAPWMGNWYFLREHQVYDGLPVNCEMGGFYQAHGRAGNGLIVDGPGVDVFVGYGRDHDCGVGAGAFTAKLGKGKILFHRVPDYLPPVQQRFVRNALAWLCS